MNAARLSSVFSPVWDNFIDRLASVMFCQRTKCIAQFVRFFVIEPSRKVGVLNLAQVIQW